VIGTCLNKSPGDRFRNMAELQHALAETVSGHDNDDRLSTEPLSTSSSTNIKLLAMISIIASVACTVYGASVLQSRMFGKVETIKNAAQKEAYQAPKLTDALDSIETDVWYKGSDEFGRVVWNSGPNLTDDDIALLQKEKEVRRILKEITVQSFNLNDDGLCEIAKLKTLEALRISLSSKLTIKGLKYLATMPQLSSIGLMVLRVPDGGIEEISRIRRLQLLGLYNAKNLKVADIRLLSDLPELNYLDLSGTKLNNDIIPILAKFKALSHLRLAKLDLTDENLEFLAKLPTLTNLWLPDNPRITDEGLRKLAKCKHLESLVLDRCDGITQAARTEFKKQNPRIAIRSLSDSGVKLLDSLQSLSGE
jgi:hypothetical protein